MEMRAIEDTAVGQDLTPPLSPLAFALHDSALSSHCSACFSLLPPHPFSPLTPAFPHIPRYVPTGTPSPLYCSPRCSSLDSSLHFSSAESHLLSLFIHSLPYAWDDSSDLRVAIRLLHIFQKLRRNDVFHWRPPSLTTKSNRRLFLGENNRHPSRESENIQDPEDDPENRIDLCENTVPKDCFLERMYGLMTNREKLIFPFLEGEEQRDAVECPGDSEDSDRTFSERIREGAELIARARSAICVGKDLKLVKQENVSVEEMVLCLVLTNAVEVLDHKTGRSLGIAVYNTTFSWINHSCSPNACYRFSVGFEHNGQRLLRIGPAAARYGSDNGNGERHLKEGSFGEDGYGPRVTVRTIKSVKKREEVTIAYSDLLQPKEMRQLELWRKYRFNCCCERCSAVPQTYVDHVLRAVCAVNPDSPKIISRTGMPAGENVRNLIESFDECISEYLSIGNPRLCYEKLENLLMHGNYDDRQELKDGETHQKLKLHPLHHLSLNAYTTLASAYKVYADDILAIDSTKDEHKLQCFSLLRTSAAYSFLLAGASHHLFMSESSIIVSIANFWTNAGESLLRLAKSTFWDSLSSSLPLKDRCLKCCLTDATSVERRDASSTQWEEIDRRQLLNCMANRTAKVWSILASDNRYLKSIRNPIDFGWVESCPISDFEFQFSVENSSGFEAMESYDETRMHIYVLSFHCLRYGAILSNICYG